MHQERPHHNLILQILEVDRRILVCVKVDDGLDFVAGLVA